MTAIDARAYAKLEYRDPAPILATLPELQRHAAASGMPMQDVNLRTHALRRFREGWQGALCCYGMSKVLAVPIQVALPTDGSANCDCVGRYQRPGEMVYVPIELKELVPAELNARATLDDVLQGLTKYSAPDLTVAIYLNRAVHVDFDAISVPELRLAAVWLLGATSPDASRYLLVGNLLERPVRCDFEYPKV